MAAQQPPFHVLQWGYEWRKWIGDFFERHIKKRVFQGTLTGVNGTVTVDIEYYLTGDIVTMRVPEVTGTSNANTMTITGLPKEVIPRYTHTHFVVIGIDAGTSVFARMELQGGASGGTLRFAVGAAGAAASWTIGGQKGLEDTTFTYALG